MVDEDGQPLALLNWRHRSVREIDELIGLCKGILADGLVNESEAGFLQDWLRSNKNAQDIWPCSVLYPRIAAMLADGTFAADEERELLQVLMQICGGKAVTADVHSMSSTLPLDDPPPAVVFHDETFCFTGKLLCGSRARCEQEVLKRGGDIASGIIEDLSYLVIGLVGSRDWLHSTFGRKIEKAVSIRAKGHPLRIVSEEQFVKALV
jgi:NAD-dependent DNA ligase